MMLSSREFFLTFYTSFAFTFIQWDLGADIGLDLWVGTSNCLTSIDNRNPVDFSSQLSRMQLELVLLSLSGSGHLKVGNILYSPVQDIFLCPSFPQVIQVHT